MIVANGNAGALIAEIVKLASAITHSTLRGSQATTSLHEVFDGSNTYKHVIENTKQKLV